MKILLASFLVLPLLGQKPQAAPSADSAKSSPEEGIPVTSRLAISKCGGCHKQDEHGNLSRLSWERATPEGWEPAMKRMQRTRGVRLTPEEARSILKYLAGDHHIELAKPEAAGMENVHLIGDLDLFNEPGEHVSVFVSSDPTVNNRVFGLARFDLSTRRMDFKPIGRAPADMAGLEVTPNKKQAYTVVVNGIYGTKRCEFWAFDLSSDKITRKEEVACRTRLTLGISSDGYQIEVYDTATLKLDKTWDLNVDVASGIAVLP
jgi:hypothetical protein